MKFDKKHKSIKIELASPETIRSWSHGEVTKPETINYKTLKTEKDGLFDEKIFGPIKSFECACGKYKKANPMNKGKVCEKCGVELTDSIVRRERMGHIELEEPVTHIWMLKVAPSRIAAVLDLKSKELEEVVYFVSYIVLDKGNSKFLETKQVLDLGNAKSSEKTRQELLNVFNEEVLPQIEDKESRDAKKAFRMIEELKDSTIPFSIDEAATLISKYTGAKFGIGASAIEYLLKEIDLDKDIKEIKETLKTTKSVTERTKLMKRLEVLDGFKESNSRPEWMILHAIPVIPPDIRPIIQLDGGRFTTSEINDLYRRIIIRNERLKKVKAMKAPSIIVNNEKRMLQEAVDALMDNDRKPRPVTGKDKRPLKSLTSTLKGKQGRFRQNLLGKRVDYSGRSVIAVGPFLKMYQVGLPKEMALTLFKPFVIQWLQEHEYADNVKAAERMIANNAPEVWDALQQVIKDRPVLMNRAPTLHRLGIEAFEPVIVKGKAMRLHPLACTAFNADFDGDQMAVHLPITPEAVAEARSLMLASHAILGPKDGKPIVVPTQDMILGNYYVTVEKKGAKGEGMLFATQEEAKTAYEEKVIDLNAFIGIPVNVLGDRMFDEADQDKYLVTSVGKILFNEIFPKKFPWINTPDIDHAEDAVKEYIIDENTPITDFVAKHECAQPIKKKELSKIIARYFKMYGSRYTAPMLDNMKQLGYDFSTISGTTISAGDVVAYDQKNEHFAEGDKKVAEINKYYEMGMLTYAEKKNRVINVWSEIKDEIQTELEGVLKKDPENPVFIMSDSGARGNVSNFTQLVGMRGLMNDTKGDIKEIPIKSSFREGLTVNEYFVSTHGARKGMADIALKTADSGYLTRRLVDVSQEIVITMDDCESTRGFKVSAIIDAKHNNTIVPLTDRITGRHAFADITDDKGNILVKKDELITADLAKKVSDAGITEVYIRSVLTCDAERGVCRKCYGINLADGEEVKLGEPVGVVAAQSIGEPGTQLTMRNFHTGGVAGDADITQGLPRIKELLDVTKPKGSIAIISKTDGKVTDVKTEDGISTITVTSESGETRNYKTVYNAILTVMKGDEVITGQKLTEGSIDIKELLEVGSVEDVENYILEEVQKVYRLQGIEISDKYIEIIVKQMLGKVKVIDAGGTELLPGEIITVRKFKDETQKALEAGIQPPLAKAVIFGIKKAPLESESWLSAASFQDTARVLTKAVIRGQEDHLAGLKENVMLGNLIPAGTGLTGTKEVEREAEIIHKEEY